MTKHLSGRAEVSVDGCPSPLWTSLGQKAWGCLRHTPNPRHNPAPLGPSPPVATSTGASAPGKGRCPLVSSENSLSSFVLAQPWPSVLGNPCSPIYYKPDCFLGGGGAKCRVRVRKMGLGDLIECLRKGTPKGHGEP